MGRLMPLECEHGNVIDGGDFIGPEDVRGCPICEGAHREREQRALDDAILAGILRRLLTGSPDLFRIDDDALHVYTRLDLSAAEDAAIRRVLEQ